MSATKFNPDARTPEEHLANVRLFLNSLEGYLEWGTTGGHRESAANCAEGLLNCAELMVAAFEAEARIERNKISAEQSAAVRAATQTPASTAMTSSRRGQTLEVA